MNNIIKIRSQKSTQLVKAIKAEQTAQALKAQAEAEARRTSHKRNEARNKARREARQKAEEEEATHRSNRGKAPKIAPVSKTEAGAKANYTQTVRALSNKSFIALYNSTRLFYNGELLKRQTHNEEILLKFLRSKDTQTALRSNRTSRTPTEELRQVILKTNEAKTPKALKFLLSFTGEAEQVTNTQESQLHQEKPVLSYNNIGYEPNEIVIIGKAQDLKVILKKFKRLNGAENQYYNFIEEAKAGNERKVQKAEKPEIITKTTPRPRDKVFKLYKEKLNEIKRTHKGNRAQAEQELLKRMFLIKYNEIKGQTKTQVQGLNNITEQEKEVLRKADKRSKGINTAEIIEEALKTDGRQKQSSIEHDIRNNQYIKTLKAESSSTLYFIVEEVEDTKPQSKAEEKKLKALINVLNGFKQSRELKEAEKEEIEEQEKEAENRSQFKANKKRKNKYNTKYGIQSPNGNPQTTHKRKTTLKPLKIARQEVREEKRRKNRRNEPSNLIKTFKRILEIKAEDYTKDFKKARRIREAHRIRHRIEEETKEYIISIYGESQAQKEYKTLKADHKTDLMFITANQL